MKYPNSGLGAFLDISVLGHSREPLNVFENLLEISLKFH